MSGEDQDSDWRDDEEAKRLADDVLRRLLNTPPKPQADMRLGTARGRKKADAGQASPAAPSGASDADGAA